MQKGIVILRIKRALVQQRLVQVRLRSESWMIRSQLAGSSARATLTVQAPRLGSLSFVPSLVKGGSPGTGVVVLTGAAPAGGVVVKLSVPPGSPVSLPSTVAIPAGSAIASFTVTTSAVGANVSVPITASLNLDSKTASLVVGK